MSREEYESFVAKAESLTKPVDSTAISFLGNFLKYVPLSMQRSIMRNGNKKTPYMGFIVDPYCFFLSYPVTDRDAARAMLPDGYELADAAFFEGDEKGPIVIISAFTVRTSVFAGMRLECYLTARSKATGRMAWIITDYETNTLSNDPKQGFCGYSGEPAFFATTPYGELLAEIENGKNGNRYSLRADISGGRMRALSQELWVEGNLAVDYGGKLKDPSSEPFSLIFDPFLMKEAREIDLSAVEIRANSFMKGVIDGSRPSSACLFPYSQHFVIRQDIGRDGIADEAGLEAQARAFLENKGFKRMEGTDITKPLFRGMLISGIANAAIILTLLALLLF
jgi:hypothetical protein